jgi:hypothetical protein
VVAAGGGGALGSAVLERLLACRGFAHVRVLVTQDFHASVRGLEPVVLGSLEEPAQMSRQHDLGEIALVVFDRERHANGRDGAFFLPAPEQLPPLARWLQRRGVQRLIVVLPHQAALLPQALKVGLANLDEQAVAAMDFAHLVIVRSAQPPGENPGGRGLQRVADLVLAQLRFMTPQQQQPVRARKVAQLAVSLALQLGASPPSTRVMPPELVWQAAQSSEPDALVRAWLAGGALPEVDVRVPRM